FLQPFFARLFCSWGQRASAWRRHRASRVLGRRASARSGGAHRASADTVRRRVSMAAAEDFAQYKLQFVDYIQHDYEVIRPIVLFAETIAERSRQTGIERTSVGDKARRFVMEGMLGLVDQRVG